MWNQKRETMPRAGLHKLQGQYLQKLLAHIYDKVPFYRQRLSKDSLGIDDISRLPELPFTTKSDLRDHYPYGLFAIPLSQVRRIHASSGTTGKPTVVGYSAADLEAWAEVCARSLVASGAKAGQIFHNAYGYGLFTGGLGMHYGAEKLGLATIPVSGGNTARQVQIFCDFGSQIVACTPSYALTLADAICEAGIAREKLQIEVFILGAEPWTEGMRNEIEQLLGVDAVNIYGLSEVIGPGVSCECREAKDGAHIFEDHFAVEVVDPQTGTPVSEGTAGELVFTTLQKEALPLLRYRTGDIASITTEPCRCGRTHARMSRIVGRTDDMLIIRGINVFPSQIETALIDIDELSPHHQIIVYREKRMDRLRVRVEARGDYFYQSSKDSKKQLAAKVTQRIQETLGISIEVVLEPPNSVPRSEGGKLQRVLDQRG